QAGRVIEEEVGNTLERLFLDFEPAPVAAASIGQVHRATLPNGRRVAVKVQRPGAPQKIEADLGLLYQAARLARERIRALDFVDTRQLVDEFARSIRKELDYRQEGRNAQNFHRHFAGHPHVHVPKVYWQYTRPRVLTLEWIDGIQLADVDLVTTSLEERREIEYRITEAWMTMIFRHGFFHGDPPPANITRPHVRTFKWIDGSHHADGDLVTTSLEERRETSYLITEAWMTMIFRHGFFHGDPHPANILLPVEAGTIGLVDFGAVGTLTD